MLTIIAPMERELAGLRRALKLRRPASSASDFPSPELPELYVVGIGKERTLDGIKKLLGSRQWSAQDGLLLLGFAGGVDPALKNGDLVLSKGYSRATGAKNPPNPPLPKGGLRESALLNREPGKSSLDKEELRKSPFIKGGFRGISSAATGKHQDFLKPDGNMRRQAVEVASEASLSVSQGESLTVDRIIATPEAKKDLYQQYGACTVNMEDYWAAEASARAGAPFLAVRAVLDPAFQGLPSCLLGVSEQPGLAALKALTRPWQAAGLLRLGRQARAAQASLARFALAFIDYRLSARERQSINSQ